MSKFDNLIDNTTLTICVGRPQELPEAMKAIAFSTREIGFKHINVYSCIPFKSLDNENIRYIPIKQMNYLDYSFFKLKHHADHIKTDFILHIHTDGFIINPFMWTDDFLNYDYIGALWGIGHHNPPVTHIDRCGNGGFTFRSKKLLNVAKEYCPPYHPEDVAICRIYRNIFLDKDIKFASDEIAAKFSIEDDTQPEYYGQKQSNRFSLKTFGFHAKWSDARNYLNDITASWEIL